MRYCLVKATKNISMLKYNKKKKLMIIVFNSGKVEKVRGISLEDYEDIKDSIIEGNR